MRLRSTPVRSRLVAVASGLSAAALLAGAASANVTLTQVSSDPYTNSTSQHAAQVEPDSFAYGNTIVAAAQTGRFYDGGSSNICWATSTDAGATWANGCLPGITVHAASPGSATRVSDPAVAYDAKHNAWLISSLPLDANVKAMGVYTSRSKIGRAHV